MKRIVIIGGGYGGLRALEHLCKYEQFHVTLIDKNPYHYMQTETYGYIAGRFDIADIAVDIQSFIKGLRKNIEFVQDEVLDINKEINEVICSANNIPYDYLILAVGAQTHFFSFIEGAQEHTHGVKNIQRAFEFRRDFESQLYHKLQHSADSEAEDFHIAIAGAGLSGVEIAAEMGYVLQHYKKAFALNSANITISLIDAAETILPGMDSYIVEKTRKRLRELGVNIYESTYISKINKESIVFSDETELPFNFAIFTAGIVGGDLIKKLDTPKNAIHQIIPDEMLRMQGTDNIFVIGDCAQIEDANEVILPPTAQIAEKSAEYVVKNIAKLDNKQLITPFNEKVDGMFIALGGNYAVGILFDKIKVSGYIAYLLKKLITRAYRFGLELKVNTGYKKRQIDVLEQHY
ncbi:MAG: FAD-dependent oxidoreductase [Campylobacterota bacterium]|nr:FAD-dependent oxidoreductase [Campylobacterota bacterium]